MAMGGTSVKDLAGGQAAGGEVDSLCTNVCEQKRLLEDSHKMLCRETEL